MENPATWNEDVKAVAAAMDNHSNQITQGIIGESVMSMIERLVIRPIREENHKLKTELRRRKVEEINRIFDVKDQA